MLQKTVGVGNCTGNMMKHHATTIDSSSNNESDDSDDDNEGHMTCLRLMSQDYSNSRVNKSDDKEEDSTQNEMMVEGAIKGDQDKAPENQSHPMGRDHRVRRPMTHCVPHMRGRFGSYKVGIRHNPETNKHRFNQDLDITGIVYEKLI